MPIALWCVLIAGVLPVLTAGLAKWGAPAFDNADPRGLANSLQGWRKRAFAAHQNGFEVFPLFAAAVLAATVRNAPQSTADLLSVAFVASRFCYVAAYVAGVPTLRSAIWAAGFLLSVAIFTLPIWA